MAMNYAEQQRNPAKHIVGITVVVLFHILLIYALVNGLGKNIVDVMKAPLETKIIKDTKPPPPEVPPPPPPQLAAPPPPYVPPPDIQIEQPPPPQSNAITEVTHAAPPPGPMVATAPPTTAPAIPDAPVSAQPIGGNKLEYPQDMLDEEREGVVGVTCDVDVSGRTSNCAVTSVSGGSSFARAAMSYVESARYRPAIRGGVPVPESHHTFRITFKLND
jgi:protein TonB